MNHDNNFIYNNYSDSLCLRSMGRQDNVEVNPCRISF